MASRLQISKRSIQILISNKIKIYSFIYLYLLRNRQSHLITNTNENFLQLINSNKIKKFYGINNRYSNTSLRIPVLGNFNKNKFEDITESDITAKYLLKNNFIEITESISSKITAKGSLQLKQCPPHLYRVIEQEKNAAQKNGFWLRPARISPGKFNQHSDLTSNFSFAPSDFDKEHSQMIEVFFGTDRLVASEKVVTDRFTNDRGAQLTLGSVKVNVPKTHKIGTLERPSWFRFEFSEDPSNHFILLDANIMVRDDFDKRVKEYIQNSEKKSAFVFVHGYNVSFEDAALRTAQIAIDLDLKSVPSFFSWPSQGKLQNYLVDEGNIEWTEPKLQEFLKIFSTASQANEIHIIAHSMGSRAVVRALYKLLEELKSAQLPSIFRDLILAAPDIDADVFKNTLLPNLLKMQQRVTLYASSHDNALIASKKIHGYSRAGDTQPSIVVAAGLETIDASTVKTDFLGHSYITASRTLLTDLSLLINNNLPAAKRPTLVIQKTANTQYWMFKP